MIIGKLNAKMIEVVPANLLIVRGISYIRRSKNDVPHPLNNDMLVTETSSRSEQQLSYGKFSMYALRISLIAALGGFLFGFETAVISGAEKTIQKLWSLSSGWQGFTVASSLIGTVIGSLLAGYPAQRFGRKKTLMGIAILYLVSAIGCALTGKWILFVISRFIGGLAVGASSVVGPMYIAEIAPAPMRGRLAGSFQLNIVFGIFVAYTSNFLFLGLGDDSWRWMLGVMVLPAALFAILLRTIPESPRWLVLNNRDEEARKIFERTGDTEAMNNIMEEHTLAAGGTKESLFNGRYRKPIMFAVLLAMFNQLAGINAILYYAPRIFEMAGFGQEKAFLQPVYIGAANLLFTLLAMSLIDRFGRKTLLIIGSFGMILFLGLTALAFRESATGNTNVLYYLIGFIAFFAFSQGAVIWVFISEIFPNSVRSQGGALGSFTHWIMAAIISWTFPIIVEGSERGGYYSFLFYCVMMVLHLLFVWKFLPETKGKSLERIQKELGIE
jgi:sugar porter (SP) family MFS transporter